MLIYILGFLFISLVGTLLHFVYEISNHNKVIAVFAAVNESTWEHIKMALTPFFLWSILDGIYYGSNPNYFFSKLISLLAIILTIPIIFYGYQIFSKKPILIIDISSFFIAIFLGQLLGYYFLNGSPVIPILNYLAIFLLILIFLFYLIATFLPVKSFLFKDPLNKKYGIAGHNHLLEKKK